MFVPTIRDNPNRNLVLTGFAAVAGYSFYKWIQARNEVNDLQVEGRAKGFVDNLQFGPSFLGDTPTLALSFKF